MKWVIIVMLMTKSFVSGQSSSDSNPQQGEQQGNAYWWLFFALIVLVLIVGVLLAIFWYRARARKARLLKQKAQYMTKEESTQQPHVQLQIPVIVRHDVIAAETRDNNVNCDPIVVPRDIDATTVDASITGLQIHRRFSQEISDVDDKSIKKCVICLKRERNTIFYSCMHLCCCESCGKTLLQSDPICPRCREEITKLDILKIKS